MVCVGVSSPDPFCCVKALRRAWCLRSRSCGIVKPQLTLTGGGAMRLRNMLGNHRISALSLGLVVSELSEEPWEVMVTTFGDSPYELLLLHSIQGNDLKSKRKFMMHTCQNFSFAVNFPEACDMILEVAVNENLKAEQMIKKVLVFTDFASGCHWKTKYEELFLDNGGEIGPHQLMEAAIADKEYQARRAVD
ncbi:hypothetical protein ACE6H2_027779 [Prunus campanulata]